MIRVLHIMPAYGGGIGSFIVNLVKSLNASDIVNDIASFTDYPEFYKAEFEKKGGQALTIKQIRLKRILTNIQEIRCIISQGNYDIVFLHATGVSALWFSTWARTCGVRRIIVHSHQTNHNKNKGWLQKIKFAIYRHITVGVATQLSSCSKMASIFRFGKKSVEEHRVMHIPNSIDIAKYGVETSDERKMAIRKELGIQNDELFIGHIGRFDPQKNHPFMLNLIKQLKHDNVKFKWVFIGAGAECERIKTMAHDMGLDSHTVFAGRRNDIAEIFMTMDISVLPSNFEGLPTVAIECQAAGTPMLLADTITDECDMGLGLLSFLSLNDNHSVWTDAIIKNAKLEHVNAHERISKIKDRKFVSEDASKLFEAFIRGEISSYNFEEYKFYNNLK